MVAGIVKSLFVRVLLIVATVGVIVAYAPADTAYADKGTGTTATSPTKVKPIISKGDDDG